MTDPTRSPVPPRRRHLSGILLCLALVLFGALFLLGFRLASRWAIPAPSTVAWGAPTLPLRLLTLDAADQPTARLVAAVSQAAPDLLLLQQVSLDALPGLAATMGIPNAPESVAFYPDTTRDAGQPPRGSAILSRFPLFEAFSIPNPGGDSFGLWAVCVVDQRKFYVASIALANAPSSPEAQDVRRSQLNHLAQAWQAKHAPPIIVAGQFYDVPDIPAWTDPTPSPISPDRFLISPDIRATARRQPFLILQTRP